jgi:hypothetical protein
MPEFSRAHMEAAAALLGCLADDLLTFRWAEDEQQFIVVAPSGQKHRFELELLEAALQPAPAPAAPNPEGAGKLPPISKSRRPAKSQPQKGRTP